MMSVRNKAALISQTAKNTFAMDDTVKAYDGCEIGSIDVGSSFRRKADQPVVLLAPSQLRDRSQNSSAELLNSRTEKSLSESGNAVIGAAITRNFGKRIMTCSSSGKYRQYQMAPCHGDFRSLSDMSHHVSRNQVFDKSFASRHDQSMVRFPIDVKKL